MIYDAPPSRMYYTRLTQNDFHPKGELNLIFNSSRNVIAVTYEGAYFTEIALSTSSLSERAHAGGIIMHMASDLYQHLLLAVGFEKTFCHIACRHLLDMNKHACVHGEQ